MKKKEIERYKERMKQGNKKGRKKQGNKKKERKRFHMRNL